MSLIEWNEVVPFAPFAAESNTSSYLQWAIPLSRIAVSATRVQPTDDASRLNELYFAGIDGYYDSDTSSHLSE